MNIRFEEHEDDDEDDTKAEFNPNSLQTWGSAQGSLIS